jgi:hypothetical protein
VTSDGTNRQQHKPGHLDERGLAFSLVDDAVEKLFVELGVPREGPPDLEQMVIDRTGLPPQPLFDPADQVGEAFALLKGAGRRDAVFDAAYDRVRGLWATESDVICVAHGLPDELRRGTLAHELAHRETPWHKAAYQHHRRTYPQSMLPEHAKPVFAELEREANHGMAAILFNRGAFIRDVASKDLAFRTIRNGAREWQASLHTTARHYVANHPRACALVVFNVSSTYHGIAPHVLSVRSHANPAFRFPTGFVHTPQMTSWRNVLGYSPAAQILLEGMAAPGSARSTYVDRAVPYLIRDRGWSECDVDGFITTRKAFFLLTPR